MSAEPILVIQTAFIGDVLLSIPLFKALKKKFSAHPLHVVCRKPLGEFLRDTGLVDHVWEVNKSNAGEWQAIVGQLKKINFAQVYSPHQSVRSALLVGKLKSPIKIGYWSWWNFPFFNFRIKRPMELPEVWLTLSLLRDSHPELFPEWEQFAHSLNFHSKSESRFTNKIPSWAQKSADRFTTVEGLPAEITASLQLNLRWVAIAPGSVWATKRWTETGFLSVAKTLSQQGYGLFWVGAQDEESLCQRLSDQLSKQNPQARSVVTAGKLKLAQTAKLFSQCDLVIANDSGAMHLASVVDVPVVAIFGPTVPEQGYIPWSENARVVQKELSCRPCGKHGHRQCPLGTHACMVGLPAEVVMPHVQDLLS